MQIAIRNSSFKNSKSIGIKNNLSMIKPRYQNINKSSLIGNQAQETREGTIIGRMANIENFDFIGIKN